MAELNLHGVVKVKLDLKHRIDEKNKKYSVLTIYSDGRDPFEIVFFSANERFEFEGHSDLFS